MNLLSRPHLNAAASARHVNDVRPLVAAESATTQRPATRRSTARTIERRRLRPLDRRCRPRLWLKSAARQTAAAANCTATTTTTPDAAATPGEIGRKEYRDRQ
jgi:hypothetical protein